MISALNDNHKENIHLKEKSNRTRMKSFPHGKALNINLKAMKEQNFFIMR